MQDCVHQENRRGKVTTILCDSCDREECYECWNWFTRKCRRCQQIICEDFVIEHMNTLGGYIILMDDKKYMYIRSIAQPRNTFIFSSYFYYDIFIKKFWEFCQISKKKGWQDIVRYIFPCYLKIKYY